MTAIPQTPIVNAGERYITGLSLAWVDDTHITISEGQARDSLNINDISLGTYVFNEETVGATINIGVVGANGTDRPVAASSRYAIFVIGDSTGYNASAGLASVSTNDPILPKGYDMFRRVGFVSTDGSTHIRKFYQYGEGMIRSYYFDVPETLLSGGSDTSFTAVTLTASLGGLPISTEVLLGVTYTPNSAANVAHFLPDGSTATNGLVRFGCGVAAVQQGTITVPAIGALGTTKFLYKVSASDSLTLTMAGYKDYLYPPQ